TAPGVDIPFSRPAQNVATKGGHHPALAQQNAVARVHLNVALPPRNHPSGGWRRRPLNPKSLTPSRRQQLDAATRIGVNSRTTIHQQITLVDDSFASYRLFREERCDGVTAPQIA